MRLAIHNQTSLQTQAQAVLSGEPSVTAGLTLREKERNGKGKLS